MTVLQDFAMKNSLNAVFTYLLLLLSFCIFTVTGPNTNPRLLVISPQFQPAAGPPLVDIDHVYYRSFLPYIHMFFGYLNHVDNHLAICTHP